MINEVVITIPYPPTINNYYKYRKSAHAVSISIYVGDEGLLHREKVQSLIIDHKRARSFKLDIPYFSIERLSVEFYIYPPDKRKRDIDNVLKCGIDSLQHGLLFKNDNQIDKLYIERMSVEEYGKIIVHIKKII